MKAGVAEKCGGDSSHLRSGGSGGNFLAILEFQLVLTTFATFTQKKTSSKIARKSFSSQKNDDLYPYPPPHIIFPLRIYTDLKNDLDGLQTG